MSSSLALAEASQLPPSGLHLTNVKNPGIGQALVAEYLAKSHTTVVATVRDLSSEIAYRLHSIRCGPESKLIVLPLDFNISSAAADAIAMLREKYGVHRLDIVISNAGICNTWARAEEVTDSDAMTHLEVNTLGLLRLYRAVFPLLSEADEPKLVYISTDLASIGRLVQSSALTVSYGMSKAAGNYLIEKINSENDKLVAFSISPG